VLLWVINIIALWSHLIVFFGGMSEVVVFGGWEDVIDGRTKELMFTEEWVLDRGVYLGIKVGYWSWFYEWVLDRVRDSFQILRTPVLVIFLLWSSGPTCKDVSAVFLGLPITRIVVLCHGGNSRWDKINDSFERSLEITNYNTTCLHFKR
jgi:hypothetical protein